MALGMRGWLCVALAGAALAACGDSFAGPLLHIDTPTGHCLQASYARSWTQIRSSVTEFGLDEMKLPSGTTRAVITSVVLKGTKGHLTIAKAAAVPGQAIGDGAVWGDPEGILFPGEWRDRRAIPGARLNYLPRGPEYPLHYNGMIWKIVLGLTPGPSGGSADHLEIHYRIDGHSHTFVGNARVGMYPTARGCARFLARPHS